MALLKTQKRFVQEKEARANEPVVRTPLQQAWRRFRKNRIAMIGACMLVLLMLFVFIGSVASPYDPDMIDLMNIRAKPSGAHWLGCDDLGRDLLTRLLHGGRISLSVGLTSALLSIYPHKPQRPSISEYSMTAIQKSPSPTAKLKRLHRKYHSTIRTWRVYESYSDVKIAATLCG